MHDDPIVEETRKARRELIEECGGDIDRLFEQARRRQSEHPDRVVSFSDEPLPPNARRKSA